MFPGQVDATPADGITHAVVVSVIPVEAAVRPHHQGIHAADAPCRFPQFLAEGDDRLLVGDGDIEALKRPLLQENWQFLLRHLPQGIVIGKERLVDAGGVAVSQFCPNQPIFHLLSLLLFPVHGYAFAIVPHSSV